MTLTQYIAMIRRRIARRFGTFVASLLLIATGGPSASHAGIILGFYPAPPTTTGVVASTRSGPNSWPLYAIEDAASTDLGIASYNVTMNGATAINNRSPNGTAIDENGDTQSWGFSLLRSGTNTNPIVASEPLAGTTPFVITGFGRSASSANSQILAADPVATGFSATSGATWGNYTTEATSGIMTQMESTTGHKWVFLAEGLGEPNYQAIVGQFTVLANAQGAQVAGNFLGTVDLFTPEPGTFSLMCVAVFAAVLRRSRP